MPARHERAERLPGRAGEGHVDRVVGQPVAGVALGDLVAEHRADGAVDVADRQLEPHRLAVAAARPRHSWISVLSSALSRPWSWPRVVPRGRRATARARGRIGARSSPAAFQCSTAPGVSSSSTWPIASSRRAEAERREVLAHLLGDELEERLRRTPACRVNRLRSSGFWVATPTGQVSRWQTRIMMQPDTTSGAVAKPNSSAPSSAAMMTSRPVFIWPSTWTVMRSRSPLSSSVCWVSARPSSHGAPACFSEVSGAAPVPPS